MTKQNQQSKDKKLVCGIIMPIATKAGYTAEHWEEVHNMIKEAASRNGFHARMVSDTEGDLIIHANIVQNIYQDDLVVIDISSKNANVLLEMGMRLAFNKPLVIITDSSEEYKTFDIGPINLLPYPQSLSWEKTNKFVDDLSSRIKAVWEAEQGGGPKFLDHFKISPVGNEIQQGDPIQLDAILNQILNIVQRQQFQPPFQKEEPMKFNAYGYPLPPPILIGIRMAPPGYHRGDTSTVKTFLSGNTSREIFRDEIFQYFRRSHQASEEIASFLTEKVVAGEQYFYYYPD